MAALFWRPPRCGANPEAAGVRDAARPPARSPHAAPAPRPRPFPFDPIDVLIETSQRHFETGERELKAGHLDKRARGVRSARSKCCSIRRTARGPTPGLREHFDRLIDRINAYEVTALAQGDGFTEKKYEAGADRRAS